MLQVLVMSVMRRWYGARRLFRHKWCYFAFFAASFVSFVLTVSYVWEGVEVPTCLPPLPFLPAPYAPLQREAHDPSREGHRNKVELIGRPKGPESPHIQPRPLILFPRLPAQV